MHDDCGHDDGHDDQDDHHDHSDHGHDEHDLCRDDKHAAKQDVDHDHC